MYFRAFMDWRTRRITAGAVLLLLAIPALLLSRPVFGSIVVIVAGLNTLVCLACFLWPPAATPWHRGRSRSIAPSENSSSPSLPSNRSAARSRLIAKVCFARLATEGFSASTDISTHHGWARTAGSPPVPPISSSSPFRTRPTFSAPMIPIGSSRRWATGKSRAIRRGFDRPILPVRYVRSRVFT
jgi:hypothetical protein